MKILKLIQLYSILEELYQYIKKHPRNIFSTIGKLSTEREFCICADRVYVSIELSDADRMIDFIKIADNDLGIFLHSTLRDDILFRYPTKTATTLMNGIYRESTGILYKAPNTFPFLHNISMDENNLDPLMFQLSTQYTINEVNSMVLANAFVSIHKGRLHYPNISIDLNSYDKLTDEEISEIIESLPNLIKR